MFSSDCAEILESIHHSVVLGRSLAIFDGVGIDVYFSNRLIYPMPAIEASQDMGFEAQWYVSGKNRLLNRFMDIGCP